MFYIFSLSDDGISPLAPPRNRNRQDTELNDDSSHLNSQSIQPASNGLPPTPKVHMGACFSKVFNYIALCNRAIKYLWFSLYRKFKVLIINLRCSMAALFGLIVLLLGFILRLIINIYWLEQMKEYIRSISMKSMKTQWIYCILDRQFGCLLSRMC